ncbi:hypothetical protein HB779_06125 [Phyllobacterium sp. 628]|uniref:hypothetical protein n=1 Tax=Phyllobacterium sp. 628 TaxID=2718938 RepID=UPI00166221A9|nr:hypothetical protein [Phyllobacterium sp. 628]QND51524.1 hypothetical protein HB779_06125 [Phyllobacterium sp. 628]
MAGTRAPEEKKDAFNQFWQAYSRKFQKLKARAAWDKINPDTVLAARIVEKAGLWAEHYSTQDTDKRWIPAPANWLAGERWDEDLPDIYIDPKEAAIAKAKERGSNPARGTSRVAANDDGELPSVPQHEWDVGPFSPFGTFGAEIVASTVKNPDAQTEEVVLTIALDGDPYKTVEHTMLTQCQDKTRQFRGRRFLDTLAKLTGADRPLKDTEELHFKPLTVTIDRGLIFYAEPRGVAA